VQSDPILVVRVNRGLDNIKMLPCKFFFLEFQACPGVNVIKRFFFVTNAHEIEATAFVSGNFGGLSCISKQAHKNNLDCLSLKSNFRLV
jgi:hypothetical protein